MPSVRPIDRSHIYVLMPCEEEARKDPEKEEWSGKVLAVERVVKASMQENEKKFRQHLDELLKKHEEAIKVNTIKLNTRN